jgi:hypothetical protein
MYGLIILGKPRRFNFLLTDAEQTPCANFYLGTLTSTIGMLLNRQLSDSRNQDFSTAAADVMTRYDPNSRCAHSSSEGENYPKLETFQRIDMRSCGNA